jgi:ATP-dependent Clp protease, protease subunit
MAKTQTIYKNVFLMSDEDGDSESLKPTKDSSISIGSNQVFFYDDVTRQSVYNLSRQLDATSKALQILTINFNLSTCPPIELYINSDGGEVLSAFSVVDRIKSSSIPIHSYCEGMVASAATLLSVCCHKRYIRKNGFMLIHQLSSGVWGPFENLKEEVANMELLMKCIKSIYLQHTNISESDLVEILKHDTYLSSEECLKLGLVDEIL